MTVYDIKEVFDNKWNILQNINTLIANTEDCDELLNYMYMLRELSMDMEEAGDSLRYNIITRSLWKTMYSVNTKYANALQTKYDVAEDDASTDNVDNEEEEEDYETDEDDSTGSYMTVEEYEPPTKVFDGLCGVMVGIFVIYAYGFFLMMSNKN